MSDVIVIAGPTAGGKSAVGLDLAQALGGEIINADAMQVYRDLSVLTARPSAAEMAMVPHHLYGTADGAESWSAGIFARAAVRVIEDVIARGRQPIVVGGTGLWLRALVEGLSPVPEIEEATVKAGEDRLAMVGMEAFRDEVLALDPVMERLKPKDRQRHLRAWAVAKSTGRPLSEWQKAPPKKISELPFSCYLLAPEREMLYTRINQRFEQMLEQGAREEVERLLQRRLPSSVPIMKAVGVPELTAAQRGEIPLEDAIAMAQQSSRRLAKRQMTWFRGEGERWSVHEQPETLISAVKASV